MSPAYPIEIPNHVSMGLCKKLAEIQKKVWGWKDIDSLPPWKLFVTPKIGGILIIAYHKETPIAFGFFTRAIEKDTKRQYLYLDMLGVLPKYQNHKLGEKILRKAQTLAKMEGLSGIQWTYDPLEGANGNLYIRKLGAVVSEYYEDYYGSLSGKQHKGSATDRFWAELRSDALPSEFPNAEMTITQQRYQDYDKSIKCLPGIIAVEIPDHKSRQDKNFHPAYF